MGQYLDMKSKYPDTILLFRVGDFYETFGKDAILTSETTGIVLTNRNNGGSKIELAGFPYHSLDLYLPKLVRAGYRVAICEQLEKPSKMKKIVKRGVTEVVTPGLISNDDLLDEKRNNFLAALSIDDQDHAGVAFLDFSTGEFDVFQGSELEVRKLISSYQPIEILHDKSIDLDSSIDKNIYRYGLDHWAFEPEDCYRRLTSHFAVKNLKGFGIESLRLGIACAGAILSYLEDTENKAKQHISTLRRIITDDFLWLDPFTIRNLELVNPMHSGGSSLLEVVDRCVTPMGSRLLKKWILFPLVNQRQIETRLDVVEELNQDLNTLDHISGLLSGLGDMTRLLTRLAAGKFAPKQTIPLLRSIKIGQEMKVFMDGMKNDVLIGMCAHISDCTDLSDRIEKLFAEDPPVIIGKGQTIRSGNHDELDELRDLLGNAKKYLVELQEREIANTGIGNLKIGFNNVFGYYLEVTNKYKNQDLIPEHWIRKQTLSNSERYITPELKELEDKILSAEEKINTIEQKLFDDFLHDSQQYITALQKNAEVLSTIDCLHSLSRCAQEHNYVKPNFTDDMTVTIENGRHPVIEYQMPPGEKYIPNNLNLNQDDQQIILITGPNMSGKSAVLRQTALISILAQMGSFVPASAATLPILDRIFTRVGASDNISSGASTFMVEMTESSNILNHLSEKSLVLLDEIGRGTSTFDGISIAWSIAEYLHNQEDKKPLTLFATHYHELNALEEKFDRISNYHVLTKESGNKVHFLRKLVPGSVAHSFGIYVARMAGMPLEVVQRAEEILALLEQQSLSPSADKPSIKNKLKELPRATQMSIFEVNDPKWEEVQSTLNGLNLNDMTPIECMIQLRSLKELLD